MISHLVIGKDGIVCCQVALLVPKPYVGASFNSWIRPIPYDPREPGYFESGPRERSSGSAVAPRPKTERVHSVEMKGHVVMVTGGATGLGRAIALEFARRGV